jgi:uncharacterized protein
MNESTRRNFLKSTAIVTSLGAGPAVSGLAGKSTTHKFVDTIIELKPSHIQGVGVFAARDLKKGEVIAEGIHEKDYKTLVPWAEFESYDPTLRQRVLDYCIGTPAGFIPPDDFDFNALSIAWYFNHSCDPNLGFNDKGDFTAIVDVPIGQELTYDYGCSDSNPAFLLNCSCGTTRCRHKVTGNDWRDPGFRASHIQYMLPRLRREPGKTPTA